MLVNSTLKSNIFLPPFSNFVFTTCVNIRSKGDGKLKKVLLESFFLLNLRKILITNLRPNNAFSYIKMRIFSFLGRFSKEKKKIFSNVNGIKVA